MTDRQRHTDTTTGVATVHDELTRYQLDILLYLGVEERNEPIGSWLARYGHEVDERRRERVLDELATDGLLQHAPGRRPPYRLSDEGKSLLRRRAQQYELTFAATGASTVDDVLDSDERRR